MSRRDGFDCFILITHTIGAVIFVLELGLFIETIADKSGPYGVVDAKQWLLVFTLLGDLLVVCMLVLLYDDDFRADFDTWCKWFYLVLILTIGFVFPFFVYYTLDSYPHPSRLYTVSK
jgi:hypothetical protein